MNSTQKPAHATRQPWNGRPMSGFTKRAFWCAAAADGGGRYMSPGVM